MSSTLTTEGSCTLTLVTITLPDSVYSTLLLTLGFALWGSVTARDELSLVPSSLPQPVTAKEQAMTMANLFNFILCVLLKLGFIFYSIVVNKIAACLYQTNKNVVL